MTASVEVTNPSTPKRSTQLRLVVVLAAITALPLTYRYLYYLTRQPQYEFAVIFLAALAAIVILRRKWYFTATPRRSALGNYLSTGAFLFLCFGILMPSAWFVYLAVVLAVGAIFCFQMRGSPYFPVIPVWLSLFIPLRAPLMYDNAALNKLRLLASIGASRIADILGIPHLLEGNVFSLPDKQFFMDDACSGIISFLTCMAVGALLAVWKSRGVAHFLSLLVCSGACAVVFNIFRVTSLIAAWRWLQVDLTAGWRHDLVGYVALCGSVVAILCIDISLNWLFADAAETRSIFTSLWNKWLANPRVDDEILATRQSEEPLRIPAVAPPSWLRTMMIVALISLIAYQAPRELRASRILAMPTTPEPIEYFGSDDFPNEIHGWMRAPGQDKTKIWRHEDRVRSVQAAFVHGDEVMIVAVAYPYDHWHDVTKCYIGHGWRIDSREIVGNLSKDPARESERNAIVHMEMFRNSTEWSTVLFAFVDEHGNALAAPRASESIWGAVRERLGLEQELYPDHKAYLIQALWPQSGSSSDRSKITDRLQLFERLVNELPKAWTQTAQSGAASAPAGK